jgi:hypothetical protein
MKSHAYRMELLKAHQRLQISFLEQCPAAVASVTA